MCSFQLTPGVYYIFRIIGIDENGKESEPNNYKVTYSDGKIKRTTPEGVVVSKKTKLID